MNIITNFFAKLFGSSEQSRSDQISADLMRRESEIGRQLFGPIPPDTERYFFCLDQRTWVWHEQNKQGTTVTKYLVKDKEIVKSVNGADYQRVSDQEAAHLRDAAILYQKRVNAEIYDQFKVK